jgi:hypothetical protein
LMSTPTMAEESAGQVHLLWDIPFGSTKQYVSITAYDRTGIKLEEDDTEYILRSKEDQEIKVSGYPAEVIMWFTKDVYERGSLEFLGFELDRTGKGRPKPETVEKAMQITRDIYASLSARYGSMNGGYFQAGSSVTDDQIPEMVAFDFPMLVNVPDFEAIRLAALYEDSVNANIIFDNILMELRTWQTADKQFQVTLTVTYYNGLPKASISSGLGKYDAKDPNHIDLNF